MKNLVFRSTFGFFYDENVSKFGFYYQNVPKFWFSGMKMSQNSGFTNKMGQNVGFFTMKMCGNFDFTNRIGHNFDFQMEISFFFFFFKKKMRGNSRVEGEKRIGLIMTIMEPLLSESVRALTATLLPGTR